MPPVDELRALFAADTSDCARMRRLAIVITLRMNDRQAADALHQQLEAAIALYETEPADGRYCLEMLNQVLVSASSHH